MYKYVNKTDSPIMDGNIELISSFGGISYELAHPGLDSLSNGYTIDRYINGVLSNPYNDPPTVDTKLKLGSTNTLDLYLDISTGSDLNNGTEDSPVASFPRLLECISNYTGNTVFGKPRIQVFISPGDYVSDPGDMYELELGPLEVTFMSTSGQPDDVILPALTVRNGVCTFSYVSIMYFTAENQCYCILSNCKLLETVSCYGAQLYMNNCTLLQNLDPLTPYILADFGAYIQLQSNIYFPEQYNYTLFEANKASTIEMWNARFHFSGEIGSVRANSYSQSVIDLRSMLSAPPNIIGEADSGGIIEYFVATPE